MTHSLHDLVLNLILMYLNLFSCLFTHSGACNNCSNRFITINQFLFQTWINIRFRCGHIFLASHIQVLLGCNKTCAIKFETGKVLLEIDLWELDLQKLDKIPVSSNPPDDNKNDMGNINIKETKEDGLDGKKDSSGAKCCLNKI